MKTTIRQLVGADSPSGQLTGALLYGSDGGLVSEGSAALISHVCGSDRGVFRLSTLAREQHGRLLEESAAMSLAGGRRVVLVQDAGDGLLAAIRTMNPTHAFTVLEAGGLAARSKLRSFAEGASDWAVIACHARSGAALEAEIRHDLSLNSVRISNDAVQAVALLGEDDRGLRRARSETLSLYAGIDGNLDLRDVQACVVEAADRDVEDAYFAAMAGDSATVDVSMASIANGEMSGPGVLAGLIYHLLKMSRARACVDAGFGLEAAIRAMAPPIFYQRQAAFGEGVRLWSAAELKVALERSRAADMACKRAGAADGLIAWQLLTTLVRQASARRMGTRHG